MRCPPLSRWVAAGLASVASAALLGCGLGATATVANGPASGPPPDRTGIRGTVPATIDAVRGAVVRLDVSTCSGSGNGSGFVVAPGLVATAAHVVRDAASISLSPERGQRADADVVGLDAEVDLALVRARGSLDGHALSFSQRDAPIGTDVIALGYPLGLPFTATEGTVTGEGRDIPVDGIDHRGLFQTDAAVNPGNSGGAVIAHDGRVVGLVVAGGPGFEGVGFGIPASRARPLIDRWIARPEPQPLATCAGGAPLQPDSSSGADERTTTSALPSGGFTSPAGRVKCDDLGDALACETPGDGYVAILRERGAADGGYDSGVTVRGGPPVDYGSTWTSASGTFRCALESEGIRCRNRSGHGFFINDEKVEPISP